MKKLAIIGCGAICRGVVEAICRGIINNVEIVSLMDRDLEKCRKIVYEYGITNVKICNSIDELLDTDPDIVLEVASPEAVREYADKVLSRGKIFIILSSGALIDKDFRERLIELCKKYGGKIYIPSGAICGFDGLKALSVVGIEKIIVRTRKPVKALPITGKIDKPEVIYRGPASEAVKKFPLNVNIVASIAIVTNIEPEVEVIADPDVSENIHEIEIISKISNVKIILKNMPSPWNPRTSYIAVFSTIFTLKQLVEENYINVGT